jgi:choloylglycine hydrolase
LSRYILDNFATVADAVAAIETGTFNIFGDVIDYFGITLPAHVTMHDATGDSALIEFISKTLSITSPIVLPPNGLDVTTNEPSYTEQVENLDNYSFFTPSLTPFVPLPGDVDSQSRFVRLSAFLSMQPLPPLAISNTAMAISYVYSMINTVVETPGSLSPTAYDPDEKSFPTWWIAIRDNINLKYILQPTQSETFYVDLTKIDFSSPKTQHRTLNLYQPGLVDDVTMLLLLGNEF